MEENAKINPTTGTTFSAWDLRKGVRKEPDARHDAACGQAGAAAEPRPCRAAWSRHRGRGAGIVPTGNR